MPHAARGLAPAAKYPARSASRSIGRLLSLMMREPRILSSGAAASRAWDARGPSVDGRGLREERMRREDHGARRSGGPAFRIGRTRQGLVATAQERSRHRIGRQPETEGELAHEAAQEHRGGEAVPLL